MANHNNKPPATHTHTQPLDEHGIVLINTDATPLAIHDALTERITQTRAMLAIAYGEENNPLCSLSQPLQHSYLWALARQLQVIERLVDLLQTRQ